MDGKDIRYRYEMDDPDDYFFDCGYIGMPWARPRNRFWSYLYRQRFCRYGER